MKQRTVRDVMTREPVTITADLPMDVALVTMRSNNVRRLPVVSDTGRVIGIITLYDALIATHKDENDWMSELVTPMPTVEDAMTANVITVGPDEDLAHVARMMIGHRVGGLPVVEEHKLVGIITESDLFGVLAEMLDAETAPDA
jgi:CBS domain-containing protein